MTPKLCISILTLYAFLPLETKKCILKLRKRLRGVLLFESMSPIDSLLAYAFKLPDDPINEQSLGTIDRP